MAGTNYGGVSGGRLAAGEGTVAGRACPAPPGWRGVKGGGGFGWWGVGGGGCKLPGGGGGGGGPGMPGPYGVAEG